MFDTDRIDVAIATIQQMAVDQNMEGMRRELRSLISYHWKNLELHAVLHGNNGVAACGPNLERPADCPFPVASYATHNQARMAINEHDLGGNTQIREVQIIDFLGDLE